MIDTSYRGPNDCLECNLVDDSWQAFSQLKDELDGIVGEEFLRSLATLHMKTDIFSGVINGKTPEVVREDNTLPESLILRLFESECEPL